MVVESRARALQLLAATFVAALTLTLSGCGASDDAQVDVTATTAYKSVYATLAALRKHPPLHPRAVLAKGLTTQAPTEIYEHYLDAHSIVICALDDAKGQLVAMNWWSGRHTHAKSWFLTTLPPVDPAERRAQALRACGAGLVPRLHRSQATAKAEANALAKGEYGTTTPGGDVSCSAERDASSCLASSQP